MSTTESLVRVLAHALVEVAVFVESADDDVLDPDAGVRLLESVAHRMQALSDADAAALGEVLLRIADDYGPERELVRELPESLGLPSEP